MKSLILLTFLVGAHCLEAPGAKFAMSKARGSCPKVRYITNVDYSLIQGRFYRHLSTDKGLSLGCNGVCLTDEFLAHPDKSLKTTECCSRVCRDEDLLVNKKVPGEFSLGRNSKMKFYILSYGKDFVLSYGCIPKGKGKKAEYVYGLTRDSAPSKKLVSHMKKKLKANQIDEKRVEIIKNSEGCFLKNCVSNKTK